MTTLIDRARQAVAMEEKPGAMVPIDRLKRGLTMSEALMQLAAELSTIEGFSPKEEELVEGVRSRAKALHNIFASALK